MKDNLKTKLCNYLINNNLVKPYQVIKHSYSTCRMNEDWHGKHHDNEIDICPTLTTRPDCLGVVVEDDRE